MTTEEWKDIPLCELATVIGGGTPSRRQPVYWDGDVPWATPTDVTGLSGRIISETASSITDAGLANSSAALLPPYSLLMTTRATIGACAINRVSMATNQGFQNLVPKQSTCVDFLYYLIQYHKRRLQRLAAGSTFLEVSKRAIHSFRVAAPPLPAQRKIAAILSSLDDAIEKTRAVIDQVQVVKRGLMQELLSRGLPGRHTRFKQTEIGKIPEEWAIVRIIDVADVDYGISAAVSANKDPGIGWPILTGANLTLDGQIDLFKLVYHEPPSKERFYLRKNDLLLNWRSGSPKHVGKTALFDLEGNYTYASFVLRIRSRGKLVPGFGHVLLNFMRNAEFFSKDLSQQVNFKMNAAVFREILIRLPPVDEQEKIALTAARFDSRLASEAQLLAALQNVKAALMSVLLTGELRVTPDTEVA